MRVIYIPSGRAKEYSDLALNIYISCNFSCKYCYCPDCLKRDRQEFYTQPSPRQGLLDKLEKDCKEYCQSKFAGKRILLSFVGDPYQDIDLDLQLTRKTLELFKQYNISFQILTKAGHRALRDFDLYKSGDAFATTLTFMDPIKSLYYEPQAATPEDRIETIIAAKKAGIETWVSFEPVLNDDEVYKLLDATYPYVDLYKVGKISRFQPDKEIDWNRFAYEIVNRLEKYGKQYYIKDDLKKHLISV
jgi:DNA repair photolyase